MAVGAVALEQGGGGLDRLQQLLVGGGGGDGHLAGGAGGAERRGRGGGRVGGGDRRGVDAEVGGDRLVEAVLALQQLLDAAQEGARLGALDDAVVVGRGQRHHLGDAELAEPVGAGVRPLGRVGDRAGGDDRALAAHQAGDRGDGADAAGVGEGDVGPLEVVGGELALPRLGDQVLVVGVEGGEVEAVGALDRRDHQAARAVLALDVDGDAEVDRPALDRERLPVPLLIGADHHRPLLGGLHDRPGDQVGEGDLHPPLVQDPVERLALRVQRVDRNRPERGGRRNLQALVHRRGQHRRRPPQSSRLPGGRRRQQQPAPAVGSRQHILLGDLRPGPAASYRAKVDAMLGSNAPRHRSRPDSVATVGVGRLSAAPLRVAWSRGGRERSRCTARRPPLLRDRTRSRASEPSAVPSSSPGSISANGAPTGTSSSTDATSFVIDAIRRRRHLGVDLVGRHLDHRVALVDEVPLGDVPLEDDALGDRLAHLGHLDLHGRRLRHPWIECMKQR